MPASLPACSREQSQLSPDSLPAIRLLMREMEVAVREEDYGEAARLRDHPWMRLAEDINMHRCGSQGCGGCTGYAHRYRGLPYRTTAAQTHLDSSYPEGFARRDHPSALLCSFSWVKLVCGQHLKMQQHLPAAMHCFSRGIYLWSSNPTVCMCVGCWLLAAGALAITTRPTSS